MEQRIATKVADRTRSQNSVVLTRMALSLSWIRAAQFSRSGRPKRGNLESCDGKNVRARLGPFHLIKAARTSS